VTVGSPLTVPLKNTLTCGDEGGCTWANTALGEPGANVASPISGTIVRFRMGGNYVGTFSLRVLRRAGGGELRAEGTSEPVEVKVTRTETGVFPAHLPIQAGDLIGIDYGYGKHLAWGTSVESSFEYWTPPLIDDGMAALGISSGPNSEILFNADVQPPPEVGGLSPARGPIGGGSQVVISGHDLEGATAVSFGGVAASGFSVESEAQITAVSPPAAKPGAVDVGVTTEAGASATGNDRFTYTACVVPRLRGKRTRAARKALRRAGCRLGRVRGRRSRRARVRRQSRRPGTVLNPGARVGVRVR
jgi:IPT/TIG domain